MDVSRADGAAVTIAEQTIKPAGQQVPIAFDLSYDPGAIKERNQYVIQVRILENDQLTFINSQAYPVITRGHPKTVNVVMKLISIRRSQTAPRPRPPSICIGYREFLKATHNTLHLSLLLRCNRVSGCGLCCLSFRFFWLLYVSRRHDICIR